MAGFEVGGAEVSQTGEHLRGRLGRPGGVYRHEQNPLGWARNGHASACCSSDKLSAMAAECEMSIRDDLCGVAAIGRCSRCGRAACFSHLNGSLGLCQACMDEQHAVYLKQLTELAAPHVRAVSQATARRLAAIQALNNLGSPGLVARRIRVGYDPKRFGRDVEHYDVYEAAWPVGECIWIYEGSGYKSGGKVSLPSGVTPSNNLVAMLNPLNWEVPIERANPRIRLAPGSVRQTEQTAEAHEMIAAALDELARSYSRGDREPRQ